MSQKKPYVLIVNLIIIIIIRLSFLKSYAINLLFSWRKIGYWIKCIQKSFVLVKITYITSFDSFILWVSRSSSSHMKWISLRSLCVNYYLVIVNALYSVRPHVCSLFSVHKPFELLCIRDCLRQLDSQGYFQAISNSSKQRDLYQERNIIEIYILNIKYFEVCLSE